MSKYTGPKAKICRREGCNIFGNEKFNKIRKNYAPGVHGPKGSFSKPSEYAKQLREKQKLARIYGVTGKQLRRYYNEAAKRREITGDVLLKILEKRLDNVIFRTGFAKSRPQARQMVNHGLFKINGVRVTIPSYRVRVGDKFEVTEKIKQSKLFEDVKKQKYAPSKWMKLDEKNIAGEITRELETEDLDKIVQTNLVVEFYSK